MLKKTVQRFFYSNNNFFQGDSESAIDLNMSKENTLYNMEESERQSSFYMDRIDKAGGKEIKDSILEVGTQVVLKYFSKAYNIQRTPNLILTHTVV